MALPQQSNKNITITLEPGIIPQVGRVILIDGSWDVVRGASMGMAVYNRRDDLVYVKYKGGEGGDPFHAEARAVWKTFEYVLQGEQEGMFHIFSDCKPLVNAILKKQTEGLPSWRAAETVKRCWTSYYQMRHRITLQHISRKAVQTHHNMANWARRSGKEGSGTPIQCQIAHLEVTYDFCSRINFFFFKRRTA
ncbi:RNase H [Carex littledalei]|uniref:RNase H n=1 Tax=Carex littledalei TaxID=544730 RepID=A0A833R1G1_9POAL|nr:RNase H [Carex littledalei]